MIKEIINIKNILIIILTGFAFMAEPIEPNNALGHPWSSNSNHSGSLGKIGDFGLSKEIKYQKKIVTPCGSGITACIISFALFYANNRLSEVYDGSWGEWGAKNN